MTETELWDDIDWLGGGERRVGERHRATLEAAAARIVPSDEDPGAREAGTVDYVIAQARRDAVTATRLADGASMLERLAREAYAVGFAEVASEAQDDLLTRLDMEGDAFFQRLVLVVMEGFYGDPRHGGNREGASWTMIGFPGPQHPNGWERPLGWYDEQVPDEGPR
jgi:gluconate 2-dehydrogenase gamma chain